MSLGIACERMLPMIESPPGFGNTDRRIAFKKFLPISAILPTIILKSFPIPVKKSPMASNISDTHSVMDLTGSIADNFFDTLSSQSFPQTQLVKSKTSFPRNPTKNPINLAAPA